VGIHALQYFDDIVIGQGIAGTTLAWQLLRRSSRVLVIDRADSVTSSKIAAGLITPITGRHLKPAWQWEKLWNPAKTFYRQIETRTETHFFDELPTVHIFTDAEEMNSFVRHKASLTTQINNPDPSLNADHFKSPFGAFEMSPAARLNAPAYLAASAKHFASLSAYRIADLNVETDIRIDGVQIVIPSLNVTSSRLTFCQGFTASANPWFRQVRFDASQGEILTVYIPGLAEHRVLRRGVWLAPLGDGLFKVGSTYDRTQLDGKTHPERREEICRRLRSFLKLSFTVVDHSAAVRPNLVGRNPVIGRHSDHPQLAYFNGLGSKGTLQAPFFAQQLTGMLLDNESPEPAIDLHARSKSQHKQSRLPKPLTQLAHDIVRDVLAEGDIAIDATAGNGYDTRFLAWSIGTSGHVYAFDIQSDAIARTSVRLTDANVSNVTLLHQPHERMADLIDIRDHGRISAVMFNLGYLPGGNKAITTRPESTGEAILAASRLLKPGGVITILVYTGHEGGRDEARLVDSVLNELHSNQFEVCQHRAPANRPVAPILHVCKSVSVRPKSTE
jgi:glycine oxidase